MDDSPPPDQAQRNVPLTVYPENGARTQGLPTAREKPHHSSDTRAGLSPAQPGRLVVVRPRPMDNSTTTRYRISCLRQRKGAQRSSSPAGPAGEAGYHGKPSSSSERTAL